MTKRTKKILEVVSADQELLEQLGRHIRGAISVDKTTDTQFGSFITTAFADSVSPEASLDMFSAIVGWDFEDLLKTVFLDIGTEVEEEC